MKLASLVATIRDMLTRAGVPSPEVDADILAGLALGFTRSEVYLGRWKDLSDAEVERALELARQRSRRVPLQYLTGEVEFYSLPFKVRRGVFIPRPETELLVMQVMASVRRDRPPIRILDLCAGSGVVGISLAVHLKPAEVVATDISVEAVEIARENAILNGVESNVDFVAGDGLGFLRTVGEGGSGFDVVACNPPYVESGAIGTLEPEVRDHDPRIALDGGLDGLSFIEGIVPRVASVLRKGGMLALEIGASQGKRARAIVEACGLESVTVHKDLNQLDRVVVGRRAGG